jgi:hypothetical protein
MATEKTVFRNDLSTKTVVSDIASSDDDTETGSCSTPSLDSSYELENLSNDCISITEEMAILKEENEESQRKRKRFDFEGDTN